jgi:hypothetical protein
MRIIHRTFSFSKPNLIDEKEYEELKQKFSKNTEYSLEPKNQFWYIFGHEVKWSVLLPLGLLLIFGTIAELTKWGFFEVIGYILMIYLMFTIFLKYIWEWSSYLYNIWEARTYYRKLKKKVISSKNYNEFRSRNRFWINMHPNT